MRIAIVFPPTSGRGGMETASTNLVCGLLEAGDEVHIFGLSESVTDPTWHQNLPWTQIGSARQSKLSSRQAIHLAFLLSKQLKAYRPEVVVVLSAFTIPIVRLAFLFSMRRIPLVSWLHFTLRMIGRKPCLRLADGHVAISGKGTQELRSYLGRNCSVFTVPNGTHSQVPPIPRPSASEPVHFVYVGRIQLDDQKRVNDILTAAARLKGDFRITLIGTGDQLPLLQQMGRDLGIDAKLHWAGWQSSPWSAVSRAHALLLTSSFEGFPMVLLEAMWRGLPCITADCETGPSDIIQPGQNGWLFPVGDVVALQSLMQRVIDDRSILPNPASVLESVRPFSLQATTDQFRRALHAVCEKGGPISRIPAASDLQRNVLQ